nr:DUF1796 family putative cysteine peptidase [Paenibacillus oenotherae]
MEQIKGKYDAIFSLGQNCLPAIQLERNGIRPYTGVIDWMDSVELEGINRLLQDRFQHFMKLENMEYAGQAGNFQLIRDMLFGIIVVHDFPADRNTPDHWPSYPEFRIKIDRRIERFLQKVATCKKILFVRTGGHLEEAEVLQSVLKGLVKHDFRVLLVNHEPVQGVVERRWPLKKLCAVSIPDGPEIWNGNDHHWRQLLSGIKLEDKS